jgi:cytochrome c-type biogenesis protein CcmE
MKPLQIALIVIAGLGVASVVSLYGNTTKYVSFQEADNLRSENPNKSYHIACKLNKAKPIVYDAQKDANHFEFTAVDSLNFEKKVIFLQPKPQDLERTETIVIIGKSQGDYFLAETILSKCPSKYEDAPVKQASMVN